MTHSGQYSAMVTRSILINALTGKVGPSTQMSGYPTNQELAASNKAAD